MNKAVMEQWVAALRSGEYKQTEGRLRAFDDNNNQPTNCFCCLGVLCDLFAKTRTDCAWGESDDEYEDCAFVVEDIETVDKVLPQLVRRWAGMNSECGDFFNEALKDEQRLTDMNDCGATFEELANVIEKNYEHL